MATLPGNGNGEDAHVGKKSDFREAADILEMADTKRPLEIRSPRSMRDLESVLNISVETENGGDEFIYNLTIKTGRCSLLKVNMEAVHNARTIRLA